MLAEFLIKFGPILASMGTSLGVGGVAVYFLKSFVSETKSTLKELSDRQAKSKLEVEKALIHIYNNVKSNKEAIDRVSDKMTELSGASTEQRKTIQDLIEKLSETNASLGKLWVVLRMLHPDKIPERLHDKIGAGS